MLLYVAWWTHYGGQVLCDLKTMYLLDTWYSLRVNKKTRMKSKAVIAIEL